MSNHPTKQSRHNFTNISDIDLKIGVQVKHLSPLLYFRVLKTNELFGRSGYSHSLKSFRKLLAKFEKMELVGAKREGAFSPKLLYPKKRLLRWRWGNRWSEYFVTDENLKTLKFYWQIGKLCQIMQSTGKNLEVNSYINSKGPWFDFYLRLKRKEVMCYGLYANLPNGRSEEEFWEQLKNNFVRGCVFNSIILTQTWNKKYQRKLMSRYLKGKRLESVAWCHIKESFTNKEDFFKGSIDDLEGINDFW